MKYTYIVFFVLVSCNKIIEIPKSTDFLGVQDIKNSKNYIKLYSNSIYNQFILCYNNSPLYNNFNVVMSMLSDELENQMIPTNNIVYNTYRNKYDEMSASNEFLVSSFFDPFYQVIIRCNNIIEIIGNRSNDEELTKIRNEMVAFRSIIYFYLVQLYGEIPLLTSSDIEQNFIIGRSSVNDILDFCINELTKVFNEISSDKLKLDFSKNDFHYTERINKFVVASYLSSIFLLKKDFHSSIKYSLYVIDNYSFNADYSNKFKLSSSENIWTFSLSNDGSFLQNNQFASYSNYKNVPTSVFYNPNVRPFSISDSIIIKFSEYDKRKLNFIDSVFYNNKWTFLSYKYKVGGIFNNNSDERLILVRLPLLYYNISEAYYLSNKKDSSLYYLNKINENNYYNYSPLLSTSLEYIINERSKEFIFENGDRWFTMNRTGIIDSVMSVFTPIKSNGQITWNPDKKYLPIPNINILRNPNLITKY